MPAEKPTKERNFDTSDQAIHKLAATILLSQYDSEFVFTQGNYAYKIRGGKGGVLYYRKGIKTEWILIANWCFYGLYMVVRYRKPIWLRPMYTSLFTKMHFTSVTFEDYNIELVSSDGQTLRSRRFSLSPPSAFNEVMSEKFGYSEEQVELLKTELGFD